MDYAKAVVEGRKLLTRSEADQWNLAKLTVEVIEAEGHGSARRWAADLGVHESHVSRLKAVWLRFGKLDGHQGSGRTFMECYTLVRVPKGQARDLVRRADRKGRKVSTEERVSRPKDRMDAVREAVKDRELRRKIVADATIWKALEPELRKRLAREKPKERVSAPKASGLAALREQFILELSALLDRGVPKGQRKPAIEALDDVELLQLWMRSFVETGDRSFEDAFEAMVAGKDLEAVPEPEVKRRRKPPEPAEIPVEAEQPPTEERPRRERKERSGPRRRRAS